MKGALLKILCSAAACLAAGAAWAQDGFPAKPIRMISPFPAGGSVDLVARMIAAKLP